MYNILIGGAAGDGIETTSETLEKFLQKQGCYIFGFRDFMSRVRGGHNFSQIRFGEQPISAHIDSLDALVVMDIESYKIHQEKVKPDGVIFHDSDIVIDDIRASALPFKEIAKKLGNVKMAGSVIIGVLLKFFGLQADYAAEIFSITLKKDLLKANIDALQAGFELAEARRKAPKKAEEKMLSMSGNLAITLGALAADIKFYSAYPMSPATTLLSYLESKAEMFGMVVEQAEDEIAAINMALGASYAGARSMVGTSGGGFSLMVEALGFSGIAEIPLVAVDVQRPGPATGLPTRTEQSDLKFVINAAQGEFPRMVIAVRNHEDAFYQTARAVELAYKYQIPVIILSEQYLADSVKTIKPFNLEGIFKAGDVPVHNNEEEYLRYKVTTSGISPNLAPGATQHVVCIDSDEHDEYGHITESATVRTQMVDKRMRKLALLKEELLEPDFIGVDDFETLFVAFGAMYGVVSEAVESLNKAKQGKYAVLVFGDVHPLPVNKLKECAQKAQRIINVEQNATGQLASVIRDEAFIQCDRSILKYDGRQMSVDDILAAVNKIEAERG